MNILLKGMHLILASGFGLFLLVGIQSQAFADTCYVWTDAQGIKHFGSIPPRDVVAKTIACQAKSAPGATQQDFDAQTLEAQRIAKEERAAQCNQERNRLKTLNTSGKRIRMIGEDGNPRYLTKEEIANEVEISQGFLDQNCS